MNRVLFYGLMLLVVLSPLPLGSNREWSWSLCALLVALFTLLWTVSNLGQHGKVTRLPNMLLPGLFLAVCAWVLIQVASWVPAGWKHPLWPMTSEVLGVNLAGTVSLAPEDTWVALLRLLSYGLVFLLAYQLGRDRNQAQTALGWLAIAGLIYAAFGLFEFWAAYSPVWLFGEEAAPPDVRSTFVNRNHFATWQGLVILCTIAWFYQKMSKPDVRPYHVPQDREMRVEKIILTAWKPLIVLLIMVTALVLTHSRGGFISTLIAAIVLLLFLERRASVQRALSRFTVIAALSVASLAFYLTSEVLVNRLEQTDITTTQRLVVFESVSKGIEDNLVLGYGYGTFANSFRLYDQNEFKVHYDRAHNTWLENAFELGVPAALTLYLCLIGLALVCFTGVRRRRRDWIYPATGVAASILVGVHATMDFSLQIPAVAILYACIMGVSCSQAYSSAGPE